ncbi:MAG: hypothetical protein ABI759_32725 [Candidatus Solibacter sp.]
MSNTNVPRLAGLLTLCVLLLATPRPAYAYVDPGSGAMVWQVVAAGVIGSLFYVRKIFTWVRDHLGFRSARVTGFLFASLFALIASPLTVTLFDGHPLPRFNDLFLVGIVLTTYLFTWESAIYLLVISLGVSAWILPPTGSFTILGFTDWYRFISFALVSVVMVVLITRLKGQVPRSPERVERSALRMHSAAAGAD